MCIYIVRIDTQTMCMHTFNMQLHSLYMHVDTYNVYVHTQYVHTCICTLDMYMVHVYAQVDGRWQSINMYTCVYVHLICMHM